MLWEIMLRLQLRGFAAFWCNTVNSNGPGPSGQENSMNWMVFAVLTVMMWGLYGVFLHTGRMAMAPGPDGLFKAFLFVGIAYFLVAIVGPLIVLYARGATWSFSPKGIQWSLLAGVVGALGAFSVLLAFGVGGKPAVVMAIIFAGAPIVNALVALVKHPPVHGFSSISWVFWLGIALAASGGALVTLYKPT
jgi:drug/metabolite transporter (DMT)-like permease